MPDDAAVIKLNEAGMEYTKRLRQPAGLQNVTMVEILESRHIYSQVLDGMSRIFGRIVLVVDSCSLPWKNVAFAAHGGKAHRP